MSRTTIRRVLFVDDDAVLLMLGAALLQRAGYEVTTARDGAEALQKFTDSGTAPFDLIITDLDMPRLDGAALLDATQRRYGASSLPVVILTGMEDAARRAALVDAGALACIAKPIDPRSFVDQLRAALRARD
jgi:CheY-like chemotaxis protein